MKSMKTRTTRLWVAGIICAALTVSGALASGTDAGFFLLLPGALVAWPVWPEGIHSHAGVASAVGYYIVYIVGNFAVWSLAFRLVLGLIFRTKGSNEPVRQ